MNRKLHRYSNGRVAVTTGSCRVHILGAEEVETLDASALSEQERSLVVANPDQFELHTKDGKALGLTRKEQKKPSNGQPQAGTMPERNP